MRYPNATTVMLIVGAGFIAGTLVTVSYIGKPHQAEAAKPSIVDNLRQIPIGKKFDERIELPEITSGKEDKLQPIAPTPIKVMPVRPSAFINDEPPVPPAPEVAPALKPPNGEIPHKTEDVGKLPTSPKPVDDVATSAHAEHNVCTKTGGVKISTQGGKSWRCLYTHTARR